MSKIDLPPEVTAPLAPFKGEEPPAPAWFDWATAQAPERFSVEVDGANIECLAWGERGKPGLVFVHGASAHADWWSFLAPFFAADYRVAALSMSGMGGSDWRRRYAYSTFAAEVHACARAAGLYEADVKPVYIGHSFGGAVVYTAALAHPDRMSLTLMVDTGFGRSPMEEDAEAAKAAERAPMPTGKVYDTQAEALARFRFLPNQAPNCLYITDFIARRSLKSVTRPDGRSGWTWRFDPTLFARLDRTGLRALLSRKPGPTVHIYGDRSLVIAQAAAWPKVLDDSVVDVVIPDAAHHIMADQPLALVSAIRACLALAPREP